MPNLPSPLLITALHAANQWPTGSAADVDELISSADGSFMAPTADTGGTNTSLIADITNMPTDFNNMDTLAWRVRARQSGRVDDSITLSIRVMNSAGTVVLAANDSGGTHDNVSLNLTATSFTNFGLPTSFLYVNTSATKTDWDGARVEVITTYTRNMGADNARAEVDTLELTGTYTQAVAGTNLTIQNSAQAQATQTVVLIPDLVIQNSAQAQSAQNVALTFPATDLVIQNSAQAQATESLVLVPDLVIQNSAQAQITDNVILVPDLVIQSSQQAQAVQNVTLTLAGTDLVIQNSAQAQTTRAVTLGVPANVYEDWSSYPDSTMGNPAALDGKRVWRQGANQTVDLSKAGWRIRDGVAYAGAGFTTTAGIPNDSVAATSSSISSARCETDLGSSDMYVRAVFGEVIGSPAGTGFGIFARVGSADSLTCYYLQIRRADNQLRLFPVTNGVFGSQIGSSVSYVFTPGDIFELRCFGTTISVRLNGTQVLSATNSTVTTGSKGGLFANTVAAGSGVRCVWWQAGALDGSGNPVENAVVDPIPMVLWSTQVMASTVTARVSAQVRNTDLVRLVVADNVGLTSPVFTSSYQAPSSLELVSFEATGLTAGTNYFYALQKAGVTIGTVRKLRTAPSGQSSFTVAMSGDAGNITTTNGYPLSIKTSNSPTYDRIVDRNPAFFLFAGDRHYRDYNLANIPAHLLALRDTFNNPRLANLSEQVPVMQIWDDHDYTGVADGSATGRDAAVELFRTAVPTDAWLVDTAITDPVGYTFAWGRTRWIILDHRSSRATGNILGTAQLNALLSLIENSTEPLIFLYVGVPWIAGSAPLADHWGAFTANRATIAEKIEDFAKGRVVILHADAHMLAIDDGTNTQYDTGTTDPGPPLLCAAPVDSETSFKTGTYSEGFVPDPVGPVHQQYATIGVNDQGSQITVTLKGWQLDGTGLNETEVLTYQFTVTNLVIQSSQQQQVTDNVVLQSDSADLVIQSSMQAQIADAVVLVPDLVIQNSAQAQASSNVVLVPVTDLVIQSSAQAQATESVSLSPVLQVQNSLQSQAADNVVLSVTGELQIQNSGQSQTIENVTLAAFYDLVIQNSGQSQLTDNVTLTAGLNIQNSQQGQFSESLTLVPDLLIQNSSQSQTTDNVIISPTYDLTIQSGAQSQAIENVVLTLGEIPLINIPYTALAPVMVAYTVLGPVFDTGPDELSPLVVVNASEPRIVSNTSSPAMIKSASYNLPLMEEKKAREPVFVKNTQQPKVSGGRPDGNN